MEQATCSIEVRTNGKGLVDITSKIDDWLALQVVRTGLLTVFCQHTTASLLIQENADPDVCKDLNDFFARLVVENPKLYRHNAEGSDDMPSHIRTALTQVQLSIPIIGGNLALGTWQGIYLFEHRASPHRRMVTLHVIGES